MGCDIHAYVETLTEYGKNKPYARCFAEVDLSRNYLLFAVLADVRNSGNVRPICLPRGLPENLSFKVQDKNTYFVDAEATEDFANDSNYVTRATAERWVRSSGCEFVNEHWVTSPDWHSHSYLNLDELKAAKALYIKAANDNYNYDPKCNELNAVIAMMEALQDECIQVRLVFWFDS